VFQAWNKPSSGLNVSEVLVWRRCRCHYENSVSRANPTKRTPSGVVICLPNWVGNGHLQQPGGAFPFKRVCSQAKNLNLGNSRGSDSGGAWGVVTLSLPTGDDMAIRYTARPTRIGTSFFASLTVLRDAPLPPALLPVRAALSLSESVGSPSQRRKHGRLAGRRWVQPW